MTITNTKLTVVETLSNVEIINQMGSDLGDLIDRFNDDSSSLRLDRTFTPSDQNLKKVQNGLRFLLDSKINKQRGKNTLLQICSEILLVPSNDEEKEIIDIIVNHYRKEPLRDLFYTNDLNYLNGVGQSNPNLCIVYTFGTKSEINPDCDLNLVNSLCTSNVTNRDFLGGKNPRSVCYDMDDGIGYTIENSIKNHTRVHKRNLINNCSNIGEVVQKLFGFDTLIWDAIENIDSDDEQKREDAINCIPIEILSPNISKFYSELKEITKTFDDYLKSIELPLSDFLKLFPNDFVDAVEEIKAQHLANHDRLSKVQRKIVTVKVSQNCAFEMDTTGDPEDIEEIIKKNFPKYYLRTSSLRSEKGKFFASPYEVEISDLEIQSVENKTEEDA